MSQSSKVYVRIRPAVYDGSGHDQNGSSVEKSLDSWDEKSLSLKTQFMFSKGNAKYTFPEMVLGPKRSQKEVYNITMPNLLNQFIQCPNGQNVLLLAYGQSGTGKTHTIFGPQSVIEKDYNDEWGLLPKLVYNTLTQMKAKNTPFFLEISAIQFFVFQCQDLLNNLSPVVIDLDGRVQGHTLHPINDVSDLEKYMKTIFQKRASVGTQLNKANADHSGSSRSHACIILTLTQKLGESYQRTEYHVTDLAGAERADKLGKPTISVFEAMMAFYQGKTNQDQSFQGPLINWELFEFGKEVVSAQMRWKQNQKYVPMKQLTTDTVRYLGSCLTGEFLMNMVVCISMAPQNGWETWFSMQYGTQLANLQSKLISRKTFKIKTTLGEMKKELESLQNSTKNPSNNLKYHNIKLNRIDELKKNDYYSEQTVITNLFLQLCCYLLYQL